jgi:hypothetical protein
VWSPASELDVDGTESPLSSVDGSSGDVGRLELWDVSPGWPLVDGSLPDPSVPELAASKSAFSRAHPTPTDITANKPSHRMPPRS